MYFLIVFVEMKRLFFEYFVWKLGITSNNAAASWLTPTFCTNLPKKKKSPQKEMSRDKDYWRSLYE